MANNPQHRFSLRMSASGSDPYYDWPTDPPSFRTIPYFQAVPVQLQDLVRDSSHRDTLDLSFAPSDCQTLSGTRNCAEACLNPRSLFRLRNLKTCILMASAALLVQNGTYSVDMSHPPTVETAETFLVPNLTDFNALWVLNNVTACITQSCTSSELGDCATSVRDLIKVKIAPSTLNVIATRLSSYCAMAEHKINPDIAGPGLILAYVLQITLAILLHLSLKFTTTWTRGIFTLLSRLLPHFTPGDLKSRTRTLGTSLQQALTTSRFAAALISTLVEFHEVQIYFVASIQIATLITFSPSNPTTSSLNSPSYGGALLNSLATTSLGVTSVSCILLVQRSLQRVGMHWWYPFVISTVTHGLALGIFATQAELMPSVEGLEGRFRDESQLTACAGEASPMVTCRPPWTVRFLRDAGSVYAVCFAGSVVWVGLMVDQIWGTEWKGEGVMGRVVKGGLMRRVKGLKEGRGWRAFEKVRRWRKSRMGRAVSRVYSVLASLAVFWMVCGYITTLRPVVARVNISNKSGWSFGQFIALAVWIPTIVKHIYYNIFGIEGGFEERIAANYTITRDDDPEKPATSVENGRLSHAATYPLLHLETRETGDGREVTPGTGTEDESTHRTW